MDIMEFRDFCLSLPFAEECTPFDEDTLVFKIGGKMFAYTSIARFNFINVKCEPEVTEDLMERLDYVGRAVHTNTRHWLAILPDRQAPDSFIRDRVAESYRLVVETMPKKIREELKKEISATGYTLEKG